MISRKLLVGLILGCGVSSVANAMTLNDAIQKAITEGPEFAVAKHGKASQEQALRQAYAGFLPTLDLSWGYGHDLNDNSTTRGAGFDGYRRLTRTDATLTASQMLFDGFEVSNDVDRNRFLTQAAAYDAHDTAENIALNTIVSYLDVLEQQKLESLAKENLQQHQRILSRIEKRAQSGIGRKADLDQARGRFALARTNYMSTQANLRDAEARFKRIVGEMPTELQVPMIPEENVPQTQDSAVTMALAEHPALRSAISEVSAAEAERRMAWSNFMPTLDLEWTARRDNNTGGTKGQSKQESTMLRMNYNIFNGGADRARLKQSASDVAESKETRNLTRRQLEESVMVSWNSFTTADAQLAYFKEHAEAALKTRDAYQKQFAVGQRTLLDLLDSENELFSAQNAYESAKFRRLNGQYELLASMGHLLPSLELALPAATQVEDAGLMGTLKQTFSTK